MANLNLYKSFYDVVRYDGFTNASKATNISQPALSYSIKTLEKEQKDNFKLELVSLDDLKNMVLNNKVANPRNIYFQKELLIILDGYKSSIQNVNVKKLKLK